MFIVPIIVKKSYPLALSFDDVTLIPQYSRVVSRSDVDLSTELKPGFRLGIPLISTCMDTVTGVEMAVALGKLGGMGIIPRFDEPEIQAGKIMKIKKNSVKTAAAIGIKEGWDYRLDLLIKAGVDAIKIDVAHGHMKRCIDVISTIRKKYPELMLMTGICATAECAEDHYRAGSDMVLVGVGGSPVCTTRIQTGSGLPTFASLLEIAPIAKKYKKTFAPLAGVNNSGMIVKALATGASAIVAGYIFAGCDESPGDIIEIEGKKYKRYAGSTSKSEKENHVKNGNGNGSKNYTVQIEGVEGLVPYRGSVKSVVEELLAGVRSGLSFSGAFNIKELWEKAEFAQVTNAGIREAGVHDLVTK